MTTNPSMDLEPQQTNSPAGPGQGSFAASGHDGPVSDQAKKMDFHDRLGSTVLAVFSESDFHAVTIRDIASRAGVSFATIYKHYGSKERLVFSFVDIWMGRLTDRIIDHLQGMADLKEKLRKIFWLQLDYYERHSDFARIIFMTLPMKTWMSDESFEQRRMFNLLMDVLRQGQEEGTLNKNVDTRILLDFILGFVQRSFIMWVQRGQKELLTARTDEMFDMIWRGIVTPEAD
ncbi:MAG: TetR/AcrR family transcriptional regulator [Thermodesulfobacteriota bacterium]